MPRLSSPQRLRSLPRPMAPELDRMPSLEGVQEASQRLEGRHLRTPFHRNEALSAAFEADVWIKNETVSPVGCFKLRGALNAVLAAQARAPVSHVVTSSTGNHGQAVAYAARSLGLRADIFVPKGSNPFKVRMIQAFGARVRVTGRDIDEAKAEAQTWSTNRGALFVDDGENVDLIHGAGTVGLEAARVQAMDAWWVPMGSGSLASGVAVAVKGLHPKSRVIAVQPTGSRAMADSFRAGRPVERAIDTIADGLVCRVPARLALAAIRAHVDDVHLVTDAKMLGAARCLLEDVHILAEPSGAAGLAAAWAHRKELRGRRFALVVTGGNIQEATLRRMLRAPRLWKAPA